MPELGAKEETKFPIINKEKLKKISTERKGAISPIKSTKSKQSFFGKLRHLIEDEKVEKDLIDEEMVDIED